MGFRDREIEIKLHTKSLNFAEVQNLLSDYLESDADLQDFSTDTYWQVPSQPQAFARLRDLGDRFQLTIKKEDKLDHRDRIEIDLDLEPTYVYSIMSYQNIAFGPSVGNIEKTYAVWFLNESTHNTVSCYTIKVNGQEIDGTFIEIEGTTIEFVETITERVREFLVDAKESNGSLYNMYLKPGRNSVYDWGQL